MAKSAPIAIYTKAWQSVGSGLFAQNLADGILAAGQPVIYICAPAQDRAFERPRAGLTRYLTGRERDSGSKLARAWASLRRIAGSAWGLARARRHTRVFIVSIPDPLIVAVPMLAVLWLTGARIIYVVHDPLPHAWRLPRWARLIENAAFASAYALSAALVVLSEAGAVTLRAHYRTGTKPVVVIAHGVFVLGDPQPLPGHRRLLVFGTLRRNKGVREAILGAIAARDAGAQFTLHVAGAPDPVEPDYWQECEPIARSRPDVIELEPGFVAQDRLEALIAQSDALVLPYRDFNSQSGVAVLAASNARPVIATASGGIGELLADGMAAVLIAPPGGADDVAAAITAFLQVDTAQWQARAMAYRAHVMATLAWPAIGQRYIDLAEAMA